MIILSGLLIFILGIILAKASVVHVLYNIELKEYKPIQISPIQFVVIPGSTLVLATKYPKKRNEVFPLLFSELLGGVIAVFSLWMLYRLHEQIELSTSGLLITFGSFVVVIIGLLYLSVFDVLTLSIPEQLVKYLYLFTIVINLLVASIRFLTERTDSRGIWQDVPFGHLDNIVMALVLAGLLWSLAYISKEQAMGAGDADIAAIIGVMLGFPESISALFFTLVIGGIVALVYVVGLSKIKNVLVPFVPIMTIGFIMGIGLSEEFIDIIFYGEI